MGQALSLAGHGKRTVPPAAWCLRPSSKAPPPASVSFDELVGLPPNHGAVPATQGAYLSTCLPSTRFRQEAKSDVQGISNLG